MNFLTDNKIPLGQWLANIVEWMTDNLGFIFQGLEIAFGSVIEMLLVMLQWPHPLMLTAFVAGLAHFMRRSWAFTLFTALGLLFIINQGYWEETTETLTLVMAASIVCMTLGVPLGIYLGHHPRVYSWFRPVLDLMQTLPTFVYLIPAIIFFGIGMVPGLVATVVFVIPAAIRATQLGISSTPEDLLECGASFGATKRQLLTSIELPHAMSNIKAGLTQTIMLSLSMVVIAALVGADGLGKPVVRALNTVNSSLGFEAGMVIVVVAILLDRILTGERKKARA